MAVKYITALITPPKRVQILRVDKSSGYWKPGQFGYAVSYSTHPGMYTMDKGPSAPGDLSYLVSKSKGKGGGALWFSAQALRFTGKEKAPRPSHARKKKISPHEAKQLVRSDGIDFRRDFHELSSSEVQRILEIARLAGYRKSKNAPGSTARMYFQYLNRLK